MKKKILVVLTSFAKYPTIPRAAEPWLEFAVADQRVITGQNPASGKAVAELLLKQLAG